jgi:phosphatidate cytidylyltransferase
MLKNRIITAAVLIPIVVAFIYFADKIWFAILFSIFAAIGAWEWAGLCKLNEKLKYLYSLFIVVILAFMFWVDSNGLYSGIVLCGAAYWTIAIVLIVLYQSGNNYLPNSPILLAAIGLLLLIPMWSSLILLKSHSGNGASLIMILMLFIWGADTAAYFAGKKWGKRKLASRVSPGKTWEGTIAGIGSSVVIALCYVVLSNEKSGINLMFVSLAVLTVIGSVFGDLMESLVKREAGQKDSGNILPGHGGVMDRIDSLTAAGPIFVSGIIYLGLV